MATLSVVLLVIAICEDLILKILRLSTLILEGPCSTTILS